MCLQQKAVFSLSGESRKSSQRMCWGRLNNHEHSDIIQKWNWDVCQGGDQFGLLPFEGRCIQCLVYSPRASPSPVLMPAY